MEVPCQQGRRVPPSLLHCQLDNSLAVTMVKANGARKSTGYTALDFKKALDHTRASNVDITDRLSSEDEDDEIVDNEEDGIEGSEDGTGISEELAPSPAVRRSKTGNSAMTRAADKVAKTVSSAVTSIVSANGTESGTRLRQKKAVTAQTNTNGTGGHISGDNEVNGSNNGDAIEEEQGQSNTFNGPVASTSKLAPSAPTSLSTAPAAVVTFKKKRGRPSKADIAARQMLVESQTASIGHPRINGTHVAPMAPGKRSPNEAGSSTQPATSARNKKLRLSHHTKQQRRQTSTPPVDVQDSLFTSQEDQPRLPVQKQEEHLSSAEENDDDGDKDGEADGQVPDQRLFRSPSVESKSLSPPPPSAHRKRQLQAQASSAGPSPVAKRTGLTVKQLQEAEALTGAASKEKTTKGKGKQSQVRPQHIAIKNAVRRLPTPSTEVDELMASDEEQEQEKQRPIQEELEMDLDPESSSSAEEDEVTKSLVVQSLPSRTPNKRQSVNRLSGIAKGNRRISEPAPATALPAKSQGTAKGKGKAREVLNDETKVATKSKGKKRSGMPLSIGQSSVPGPSNAPGNSAGDPQAASKGARAARKSSRAASSIAGPSTQPAKQTASVNDVEDDGDDQEGEGDEADSEDEEEAPASAPRERHDWVRRRLSRISLHEQRALLAHRERSAERVRGNPWMEDEEITLILALNDMFADLPRINGKLTAADVRYVMNRRWRKLQELHGDNGTLSDVLR